MFCNLREVEASACPTGPCRREGRAWRLSNLLKEEEQEQDEEEKKEDDDDDDDGGEEEVRYSGGQSGGGGGHVGKMFLGPFCHLSPSPAAPASRFFSQRRS